MKHDSETKPRQQDSRDNQELRGASNGIDVADYIDTLLATEKLRYCGSQALLALLGMRNGCLQLGLGGGHLNLYLGLRQPAS